MKTLLRNSLKMRDYLEGDGMLEDLLWVLMSVRIIGQIFYGVYYFVTTNSPAYLLSFGIMATAYLIALIGIIMYRKWGFWIGGILSALNIAWLPYVAESMWDYLAVVVDAIIIYLVIENYKYAE